MTLVEFLKFVRKWNREHVKGNYIFAWPVVSEKGEVEYELLDNDCFFARRFLPGLPIHSRVDAFGDTLHYSRLAKPEVALLSILLLGYGQVVFTENAET